MSILSSKRVFFLAVAILLGTSLFASNPSPRTYARSAFDEKNGVTVLFGGRGEFDRATQLVHDSDETWFWTGGRWVQQFPLDRPEQRNSHAMVYDKARQRVVLFGGRREPVEVQGDPKLLNDMWIWTGDNWTVLDTGTAPSPRQNPGMAYDIDNDKIVLFGGSFIDEELVAQPIFDTWEFDGATWTQVGSSSNSPDVAKPVLAYDAARKQTIMMGIDNDDFAIVMYRYDSAAKTWSRVTPTTMPPCGNEGNLVFQTATQKLLYMGGICTTGTSILDELFEWDGTNWTKITTTNQITRAFAQAVSYDVIREQVVIFGGSTIGTTGVRSDLQTYRAGTFRFPILLVRPTPRSLAGFDTDPVRGTVWLFGGLFESSGFLDDLWGYRNQQWFRISATGGPGECTTPLTAYDNDRDRLVVVCNGTNIFEFDPAALTWTSPAATRPPAARRFAGIAYDQRLKKTVMFGGFGATSNYFNETWTWDGTAWTEIETRDSEAPNHRALLSMWYDPLLQKTIVYGGLGRPNLNARVTRYSDMWSFDGTKWTKLNVNTTPGQRFGAQIAVHPISGKLLLVGGLRAVQEGDERLDQFYANDTWEWNGASSSWTELHPVRSPDTRENGMLAWDPAAQEMILFGGYNAGFYRSDVWAWNGENWRPLIDQAVRRRPSGGAPPPPTNPTGD